MTAEPLRPVELLRDDHEVEGFNCGRVELDNWLVRTAQVAASAGTAATYVLCRGRKVVGYYALAMGSVAHSSAPSRLRHGMPDPVPVVVLARLARASTATSSVSGDGHPVAWQEGMPRC